ncbi:flippase-like domain-containing protein [Candidatus Nitrosacidococcus tergens]|uniref:Putative Membrane protein n=1 Tax=Candidatus Nitrosacidococcus tergens TaxID=553981 RepID=A0A7G1Q9U3_9GAMM|nr:flippase-like domain-containing protein [Candidatus Nitrosacidococcus tergens]CAB1275635.1 putative Membrane protein [Candidatus Nitrosacidococcus tergens]
MRLSILLITIAGIILAIWLIVQQGLDNVIQAVQSVGWKGTFAVVMTHILQIIFSGIAWQILFRHSWSPSIPAFIHTRWIREAMDNLIPMVASIGGTVIGARLLTLRGLKSSNASASAIIDLTAEAISHIVFTLLGLGLLIHSGYHGQIVKWILIGSILLVFSIFIFILIQRSSALLSVERFFSWITKRFSISNAIKGLHNNIQEFYRNPKDLLACIYIHFIAWFLGSFEIWFMLYFAGIPINFTQAIILESLGQAIRSAGAIVPGAYGVQEGGYMILSSLFGIAPEIGLALSIIKRLRDIILGIPALITLQILEYKKKQVKSII